MHAAGWRLDMLDRWSDAGRPHNEDAIGATRWAAWAIDGTKGPFDHQLTPGPTDATWHARALDRALAAQYADLSADPAGSLAKVAEELSQTYAENAAAAPPHEQPSACLALAACDASGLLHLFNLGDCRILVETGGTMRQFGSSGIEALETAAIAELDRLRETMDEDDVRQRLRHLLRRNFEIAMNQPGGYWVVHPNLPWLHAMQHATLAPREAEHLLLASDGFYRLVNVFRVYDDGGLLAAALRGGLATLGAELRHREAADPDCRRYPRLKSADDASAILVRLAKQD